MWWPFRHRRVTKAKQALTRVVAGMIIGGAIGSIIGKKLVEECGKKEELDEKEKMLTK